LGKISFQKLGEEPRRGQKFSSLFKVGSLKERGLLGGLNGVFQRNGFPWGKGFSIKGLIKG